MTTSSETSDSFRASTVLFDLDGTLTDSAPGIWAGFRHAMASVGRPEPTTAMLSTVVGPPLLESFLGFGLDHAVAEQAVAAYRARYDDRGWAENAVFDGIDAALAELHEAGVTLALATSKNEMFAHRILEHFGLADYFTVIAGATADGSRQSKADVIAHALAGTGYAPTAAARGGTSGVVIVGDRVHDVEGAAVWGIPAVFVEWGYGPAAESAGARWTVPTVAEMSSLLRTITSESVRVDDGWSVS
ncbi:MAG: HAD hydrolase-like protein [Rhodococcus sp. (in: high G+C Gram-positive bacteria)]